MSREISVATASTPAGTDEANAARLRILDAAFAAFMESGYAATSTLEIATRARVSKRELYARVGNKQQMLMACIQERAKRWAIPAGLPVPGDREELQQLLVGCCTQLMREVSDPAVVAVFRLAIAEAVQAPEVARTLDATGREAYRLLLRRIMTDAVNAQLLGGQPAELAAQLGGLLWGDLLVSLLLGVAEQPKARKIAARARSAVAAFLQLHPPPASR